MCTSCHLFHSDNTSDTCLDAYCLLFTANMFLNSPESFGIVKEFISCFTWCEFGC